MAQVYFPAPRVFARIPGWLFQVALWLRTWFAGIGKFLRSMIAIVRTSKMVAQIPTAVAKLMRLGTHRVHRVRAHLRPGRDWFYAIDKAAGRC